MFIDLIMYMYIHQKLDKFLDHVMSRRLIGDGTVAPDISKVITKGGKSHNKLTVSPTYMYIPQRRALWGLRECISEAVVREGVAYKVSI